MEPIPLKRDDPIDEHEMKVICAAMEAAQVILDTIPFREFKIKVEEI
jgi:hypothetical protein